jgi:hypothetical protein
MREHKKEADRKWRRKNPDYFKGRYSLYLEPWLEKHPGYLKEYRGRKKKAAIAGNNDIQDKLTSVNSMNYVVFSNLRDIQDELRVLTCLAP